MKQSNAVVLKARTARSSPAGKTAACPRELRPHRQLAVAVRGHAVGPLPVLGRGAAVAGDDADVLALDVHVDAGHPGVDLVGEQALALFLDEGGPLVHRIPSGVGDAQAAPLQVAEEIPDPLDVYTE